MIQHDKSHTHENTQVFLEIVEMRRSSIGDVLSAKLCLNTADHEFNYFKTSYRALAYYLTFHRFIPPLTPLKKSLRCSQVRVFTLASLCSGDLALHALLASTNHLPFTSDLSNTPHSLAQHVLHTKRFFPHAAVMISQLYTIKRCLCGVAATLPRYSLKL